ncbi:MAG: hypothetical protein SFY32_01305 [Bacteroidota bacterium]|nr:hypothetical protein [Bacteroidota bacterium]
MDLIKELVYVLRMNPSKSIQLVLPEGSKMRKLFNAISKDKIHTDDEAAELIYESSSKDKKYLMLKKNLRDRLIDILVTSEPSEDESDKYLNVRFKLKKQLIVAQKLLENNVFHNAENILIDVKEQAQKIFLIDVLLDALFQLRHMYMLMGYPDETKAIHAETVRITSQYHLETESNGAYELVKSRIKFKKGNDYETAKIAQEYVEKLSVFFDISNSPFIKLNLLRLQLIVNKQTNNILSNTTVLNEFKKELAKYNFLETNQIKLELYVEYAQFYLQTNDFKNAEHYIHKALKTSSFEAFNVFEVLSLEFEYLIKTKSYSKATELIEKMYSQPQYDYIHKYDKAAWYLREAYLFYIKGKEGLSPDTFSFKTQIDEKVLQEMLQPLNKDKTGWNLWYMLLKLLLLRESKSSNFENEANNLNVYSQRYIKDSTEFRTLTFIKLISKAAKKNFSTSFFQENSDITLYFGDNNLVCDNCEFIPYPVLWKYFKG